MLLPAGAVPCEMPVASAQSAFLCVKDERALGSGVVRRIGERRRTDTDDVMRKTPPSALASNVGFAARRRWRLLLVLTFQHCTLSGVGPVIQARAARLVPFFFVQGIEVAESAKFGPALKGSELAWTHGTASWENASTGRRRERRYCQKGVRTALLMRISRPPRPSIVSLIRRLQSACAPTSYMVPVDVSKLAVFKTGTSSHSAIFIALPSIRGILSV